MALLQAASLLCDVDFGSDSSSAHEGIQRFFWSHLTLGDFPSCLHTFALIVPLPGGPSVHPFTCPHHSILSGLCMDFSMKADRQTDIHTQLKCWFSSPSLISIRRLKSGSGTSQNTSRETLFNTTCKLFCDTVMPLFLQSKCPEMTALWASKLPPGARGNHFLTGSQHSGRWAQLTDDAQGSVPQLTAGLLCRSPGWGLLAPAGKLRGG